MGLVRPVYNLFNADGMPLMSTWAAVTP